MQSEAPVLQEEQVKTCFLPVFVQLQHAPDGSQHRQIA